MITEADTCRKYILPKLTVSEQIKGTVYLSLDTNTNMDLKLNKLSL